MTAAEGPGATATSDALAGTEWAIVALDDAPLFEAGEPLVVAFGHDGRVSGSTGVNRLTASYSLTADYLTFGPLATTRRSGSPEEMEQEQRLVASLAGMCPFDLTVHTLTIDGPLGRVDLVTTAPLQEPFEPEPDRAALDELAPPVDD